MTEPQTEAGRRSHDCTSCDEYSHDACETCWEQARADLAARIVAAVEGLPGIRPVGYPVVVDHLVHRAAVLDAIREASDDRA